MFHSTNFLHHAFHALIRFLPSPLGPLLVIFVLQLFLLTWLEQRTGPYKVPLRTVFLGDFLTTVYVFFFVVPLCDRYSGWMETQAIVPAHWQQVPLALRVLVYIVAADLGHYGLHRLMHTPLFWRVHRWHHAADHMGFLACTRVSLIDRMFSIAAYIFFSPLLVPAPWWVWTGTLLFAWAKNDWMHLNVNWGARWVEWVLVTPRYHHIHHSDNKAHYDRNIAPFFSFWDRLFGTYVDPAPHLGNLKFGINERVPAAKLVIGL